MFISFQLSKLELPNHWMKNFFYCQKYLDLQLNEQMLGMTQYLFNCGFSDSIFLQSRVAVCYHNKRCKFKIIIIIVFV